MLLATATLWVLVQAACAATAMRALRRRLRAPEGARASGSVLLVRPCAGAEPELTARLARRGGAGDVLFAVAREDDPALPAVREAARLLEEEGARARVLVTGALGPNQKSDQLARALDAAASDAHVLVFADSDVELADDDVTALAASTDDATVGAAWAPPVEDGLVATAGDAASHAVLGGSLHAFPLLAGIDRRGMVGKLFAVRRETLEAIGGFSTLRRHLGEDMELARRLDALGLRVVAARRVARSKARGRSLAEVHDRYVRWLTVIRAQRAPLLASYPLLLAPSPLLLALGAFALVRGDAPLLGVVAVGLVTRFAVAASARAASSGRPTLARTVSDAMIADAVLTAAWITALSTRKVRWRDRALAVGAGGLLEEGP